MQVQKSFTINGTYYTAITYRVNVSFAPHCIAAFFGKDHTTCIHSERTVIDLMHTDIEYRIEVNEINAAISNDVQ